MLPEPTSLSVRLNRRSPAGRHFAAGRRTKPWPAPRGVQGRSQGGMVIWKAVVLKAGTSRRPFAVGISGLQQLHRAVSAVSGCSRELANRALPAAGTWTARCRVQTGAGDVVSGRFTEEEPEGASSLLNLRPCRIRYDVTKEWTNFSGLKRGTRVDSREAITARVTFGEDNSERGIQSDVKQRLNSVPT